MISEALKKKEGIQITVSNYSLSQTTGCRAGTVSSQKHLFSYCLLPASIKAGAAWRIRSVWGKTPSFPRSPVTLTGGTNGGWTLVTPVSHIYWAHVPSRLNRESRKCCWNYLTSFPADHPAGRRRNADGLSVWLSPGLTEPRENPECWHSIQSAVHSPPPWPSGTSGTTGTKATDLSTRIQCYQVSQTCKKASIDTLLPHFLYSCFFVPCDTDLTSRAR